MSHLKSFIIALIFMLYLSVTSIGYSQTMYCYERNTGVCDDVDHVVVLRKAAANNTHAELPWYSNYSYVVCCYTDNIDTLSVTIDPLCDQGALLSLSSDSNAHVAPFHYTYSKYQLCFKSEYQGSISCSIQQGDCVDSVCLASISNSTFGLENAHIAQCNFYQYNVCCNYSIRGVEVGVAVKGTEYFSDTTFSIYVGTYGQFNIVLKNPTGMEQLVSLGLKANMQEFDALTYFTDHKYDQYRKKLSVLVEPHSTTYVSVTTFGVKPGTYQIEITNGDEFNPQKYLTVTINVIEGEKAKESYLTAPGLSWLSIILIGVLASFVFVSRF